MLRRVWIVGLVAIGLAGGAACSDADEGGPGAQDAYANAFVDAARAGGGDVDEDRERCFAESAVGAISVARLRDAGVTPDDIRQSGASSPADLGVEVSEAAGEAYYERLGRCLDVREYVLEVVTGGVELPDESVTCLEDAFDEALVRRVVVTEFVQGRDAGSSDVAEELNGVYAGCAPSSSG